MEFEWDWLPFSNRFYPGELAFSTMNDSVSVGALPAWAFSQRGEQPWITPGTFFRFKIHRTGQFSIRNEHSKPWESNLMVAEQRNVTQIKGTFINICVRFCTAQAPITHYLLCPSMAFQTYFNWEMIGSHLSLRPLRWFAAEAGSEIYARMCIRRTHQTPWVPL